MKSEVQFALILAIFFGSFCYHQSYALDENSLVDTFQVQPSDLLLQNYNHSKILFIAEANHSHFKSQALMADLLKRVGNDPKLRYIGLERFHEAKGFYQEASLRDLDEVISNFPFPSTDPQALNKTICYSPEWAYTFANIMPLVRQINLKRPKGHELIVVPIDGDSLWNHKDDYWPQEYVPLEQKECTFNYPSTDTNGRGLFYSGSG